MPGRTTHGRRSSAAVEELGRGVGGRSDVDDPAGIVDDEQAVVEMEDAAVVERRQQPRPDRERGLARQVHRVRLAGDQRRRTPDSERPGSMDPGRVVMRQVSGALALLAAHLDEVGRPLGAAAVDRRRAAVPATGAGDRLGLVLVLVDHVLEGHVDGGLDGRAAVQWTLQHGWARGVRGERPFYPKSPFPAGPERPASRREPSVGPEVIPDPARDPRQLAGQRPDRPPTLLAGLAPGGRLADDPRAEGAGRLRREGSRLATGLVAIGRASAGSPAASRARAARIRPTTSDGPTPFPL